jgi:hypothetical protein
VQYFWQWSKSCHSCSELHSECSTCVNTNDVPLCTTCQPGYYLAWWNYCDSCENKIDNCRSCAKGADYVAHCSECHDAHFLSVDGKCVSCEEVSEDCVRCQIVNGVPTCLEYTDGETTTDGEDDGEGTIPPFECSTAISGCEECTWALDSWVCTQCASGHYLTAEQTCEACHTVSNGCTKCCSSETGGECQSCDVGFYLNGVGACTTCSNIHLGCDVCDFSNGIPECLKCDGSFTLFNQTCILGFSLGASNLFFSAAALVSLVLFFVTL